MFAQTKISDKPFFSICIPQYDRTSFLIEALKVLGQQTCRDFEICISDDLSPDGRQEEVIRWLEQSGMAFVFRTNAKNLRYDGNLRSSLELASGRYCLLHGNDDCLSGTETLQRLHDLILAHDSPDVVITNFEDWDSGEVTRRVRATRISGAGPDAAVANFRNVAFVTGVLLNREKAQGLASDQWDGSEMYQMWLMARILGEGGRVLTVDESLVRKDIRVVGQDVDSYARKKRLNPCPIVERTPPFCQIGRLITDGIAPFVSPPQRDILFERVFAQLYQFTYPFWLFEYRRVQSWNYAAGIALGIRPAIVVGDTPLSLWRRTRLTMLYLVVCFVGLLGPHWLFDRLRPSLYRIAKSGKILFRGRVA